MIDVLDRLFPRARNLNEDYGGGNSIWSSLFRGSQSSSGVSVTPANAMRQATVNACVRVLAETMAQLPKPVYQRRGNGPRSFATDHPVDYIFRIAPNPWQTPFEFVEMMEGHLALRGNAYAQIVPGIRGAVTELWPLHPDRMKVERLENQRLVYKSRDERGLETTYAQDQIFHLRTISADGLTGMSTIEMGKDTIGLDLAAERYQGSTFKNGIKPSGYLQGPPGLKKADAELMQTSLMEAYAGEVNWQKPMVTWGGVKWEQIGMTNQDAEFLESRKFTANEICKLFRMPPHMVDILEQSTNNNIEQQSLEFVLYTILPWCRRWEEAIGRDLIVEPEEFYIRFNLRGLLRGDAKTRSEFYKTMVFSGLMSPNEVRDLEDLDPYDGGDEFFMQTAMATVKNIVNPPKAPAPAVSVDFKQREEQQRAAEIENARLEAQIDIHKANATALAVQITTKDQELLAAKESISRAVLMVEQKTTQLAVAATDLTTSREQIEALTTVVRACEVDLEAKRLAGQKLQEQLDEELAHLDLLRQEVDVLRLEADSATAKLDAAAEDNARLLLECSQRMAALEAEGVLRTFKKKGGAGRLDEFYQRHGDRLMLALEPLIAQRTVLCECISAGTYISAYLEESQREIASALQGDAATAIERLQALLANRELRAAKIIEHLNPCRNGGRR